MFEGNLTRKEHAKSQDPPFISDEQWFPTNLTYHHEPRLAEDSHELVNQAIEIKQDHCQALDESSKERFMKTFGLGPCILFCASMPEKEKLGAIHFDAKSDISGLMEELKEKLGIKDFNGFTIKLVGGIKEMEGSEMLEEGIKKYLKDAGINIDYDTTMQLSESDYKDFILEEYAPMLCYQHLIIDKKTGEILSFDPRNKKVKLD